MRAEVPRVSLVEMDFIEVDYNRELRALEATLREVKQPGDFYTAGTVEIPMPRIEVGSAGVLSFPIPTTQIESLVGLATRAPYGRGEETLIDTAVRNVWQISPGDVKIGGKTWAASFESIVSKAGAGLGCREGSISAELYKLLIYDRGGFFLAHRDTEKSAGMFGTLVVTLPSFYRGGALRIRHGDREVTVETNANEPSEVCYTAFYADCEHEALPVEDGNRVCLIYNLVQKPTKGRQRVLKAPAYGPIIADVASIFDAYWKTPGTPVKIAWLLEHQYSPEGLSFVSLKGTDSARANVLMQAAERANGVAHLAIVHIGQSGAAEPDYFHSPRKSRYRYYEDDDEEFEAEDEDAEFSAVTVDEHWQYLDEWRDTNDCAVNFGEIPLNKGELLPAGALDEEPPDDQRLTEASGNEGATYERSYHRAALILWPSSRTIDLLLQGGVAAVLPHLRTLAKSEGSTGEALAVAQRLLTLWSANAERDSLHSPEPADRETMLATLIELSAPALIEQFVLDVVRREYDGSENTLLQASVGVLGAKRAASVFSVLVGAWIPQRPDECSQLLYLISQDADPAFRQIAEAALANFDGIGKRFVAREDRISWTDRSRSRPRSGLRPEFIVNLFAALPLLDGPELCEDAARKIASSPEVFDPVSLVVPSIEKIGAEGDRRMPAVSRAIETLWTGAAEWLLSRSEVPPQPPPDWRLDRRISCTCADCRELEAFVQDPVEKVHRFRVNKDRRGHLHRTIESHGLDMTHVTVRAGSPQTLVCTKDQRTFVARQKEYQNEVAAMRKLLELAKFSKGGAALGRRLQSAIRASAP